MIKLGFLVFYFAFFIWGGLSHATQAQFLLPEYAASVPLRLDGVILGEATMKLKGDEVVAIEKATLLPILKRATKTQVWRTLEGGVAWVVPQALSFPLRFDPENAWVDLDIPIEKRSAHKLKATLNQADALSDQALDPAPFGGALNYRLEKSWGTETLGGDSSSIFFDTFININGLVLESQNNYQSSDAESGWFRGDTRVVKDFTSKRVRTELGDVYPSSFGFMPARPVGGLHVARNFTLDPYNIPFPQGQGTFRLASRSQVRTFVNGVQIKEEILPAGSYSLRDVPLINGLNTVVVEATDDLGQKKIFEFRLPTSVSLLRKGEWNFALSHGRPFLDQGFHRGYVENEITSGYLQHGLDRSITLGAYSQRQDDFSLNGAEWGVASTWGNWFLGGAVSEDEDIAAGAGALTWQLQSLGTRIFTTYTLTARHERYGDGFRNQNGNTNALLRSQWQTNITIPLKEMLTLSVGANWGDVRDPKLAEKIGWDSTLSVRAFDDVNVSFFISRNRDELKKWTDIAYIFFTWTFDNASHFVTGFHDIENRVNRVIGVQDNANKLYSPRLTGTIEEGAQRDSLEMDGFIPTPVADVGGRVSAAKLKDSRTTDARGTARLASAIVFAYEKDQIGLGFSRPVTNSFVLFKPSESLRKEKIALRSTSPFHEGASGPLGEITFTNLLPYQYREVQLDPSGLTDGTSLVQEKFVVYPTYRSAHLISLADKGTVVLSGVLLNHRSQPLSLAVGDVGGKPFFTTREGRFFIEGLDPGQHELRLEGYRTHVFRLELRDRGIKDVGAITLQSEDP